MMTSFPSLPSHHAQAHSVPGWARSVSHRRTGIMVLILALLFTIASYTLQVMLNYPAILIDKASFAKSLVAQGGAAALLGFIGLLLCGLLLIVASLGLTLHMREQRRRGVIVTGGIAGMFWAVSALLGLVLVPLWGSAHTNVAQVLAPILLVLAELAAPLLLVLWTWTLARQLRVLKGLNVVGAIGLLLVFLRSLFWIINALVPIEAGFYATAGIWPYPT